MTALNTADKKLHDKPLHQDESTLREVFTRLSSHGTVLVIVDQPATIGALPVTMARALGIEVVYLPGLAMRRIAGLHPGNAKTFVYPNAVMRAANPALRQSDPLLEERWTSRRAHQEQDPAAMFRDLTVPVLLVRGDPEAGGLLDAEAAGRALSHLTVPYRHVYVPGAPHAVHAKEPATVRQAILECAHVWLPASKTHHWTTTEGVDPSHNSRMMSGTTISDNN